MDAAQSAARREKRHASGEPLRVQEVEREHLGHRVHVLGRGGDRLPDAGVQFTAAPERQALVRHVAHQAVAEPEAAPAVGLEQPRERADRRRAGLETLVLEQARRELLGEAHPQHREVPQPGAIARREPVDLRHHETLDGSGQLLHRAAGLDHGVQHRLQEPRAAAGAAHEQVDRLRRERHLLGGQVDQRDRRLRGERLEREPRVEVLGVLLALRVRISARHEEQERQFVHARHHGPHEVGRRLVHPLRVLDHRDLGTGRRLDEEVADRALQALAPILLFQGRHLGGVGDVEVQRHGEQGEPREQLGARLAHPGLEGGDGLVVVEVE